MNLKWAMLATAVLGTFAGCMEGVETEAEVAANEAAATYSEPGGMPPLCKASAVFDKTEGACSYLFENMIPEGCKYFTVHTRAGRSESSFVAYGVCAEPAQVFFQITGSYKLGWDDKLNEQLGSEAIKSDLPNKLDHGTGGGGLITKGPPPQPWPNNPGPFAVSALVDYSKQKQGVFDASKALDDLSFGQ
jgi:hypothetical protein